ncbi:MAG: hypothetical protein Q7J25_06095 [Vicinamibacterales bacterium]|nr:hypothetical protein [Vicinamibacterales bacterium]
MTASSSITASAPHHIGVWKVLAAPAQTVRALAARPNPVLWLTATVAVMAAARAALLATPVGQQALVDQWVQRAEAFGMTVDEALYARITALGTAGALYGLGLALALGVLLPLALATGMRLLSGGRASWGVALTLAAYASVALAARDLVALPVGYVRESLTSPLTLGTFFPMLDEASPLARFLWAVDLFVVWWLVLAALGAAALSGRRAGSLVTSAAVVYVAAGLVLAAVMFAAGGGA